MSADAAEAVTPIDKASYRRMNNGKGPKIAPPFTKESAAEMGRRSAAAQKRKRDELARKALAMLRIADEEKVNVPSMAQFPEYGEALFMKLILEVLSGVAKSRTAAESMAICEKLFNMLRLTKGEATQITGSLTRHQIEAQVKDLQSRIEQRSAQKIVGA